jgi:hypothetical protein
MIEFGYIYQDRGSASFIHLRESHGIIRMTYADTPKAHMLHPTAQSARACLEKYFDHECDGDDRALDEYELRCVKVTMSLV